MEHPSCHVLFKNKKSCHCVFVRIHCTLVVLRSRYCALRMMQKIPMAEIKKWLKIDKKLKLKIKMVKIFFEWWEDNCMQYQYPIQILRTRVISYSKPIGFARKFVTPGFWEFVLLKVPQAFSYVILNVVATAIKL